MVIIYTLEGCRFCQEAIRLLQEEGILYQEFEESKHTVKCERLQEALNTDYYPIIKIPSPNQPLFIISDSSEYPRSPYPHLLYYKSIPHLIQLIKTNI